MVSMSWALLLLILPLFKPLLSIAQNKTRGFSIFIAQKKKATSLKQETKKKEKKIASKRS